MELLKLIPACKDYLWGGNRLKKDYGIDYNGNVLAEAWLLSCHKDGESLVANGKYAGKTLTEVANNCGKEIFGTNCNGYEEFPILIKLIDAKKPLSIQVHPDDSYALEHEGQYGKTEMWYVLDAKEGAFIYQGFERDISVNEFEERIKNNSLIDVLHKVYVKKGDVIFIAPGTLHAIGESVLVAEIQQNSNVTYRIYDYGRLGIDGKPRRLHIEQSLDVTRLSHPEQYESQNKHLVSCDFFNVDHFVVEDNKIFEDVADDSSFVSLIITEGCVKIICDQERIIANKGESVFISAGSGKFSIGGNGEFLVTTVPKKEVDSLKEIA